MESLTSGSLIHTKATLVVVTKRHYFTTCEGITSVTCAKGADVQSLPTSTRDGCIAKSILITQEMPHTALAKE